MNAATNRNTYDDRPGGWSYAFALLLPFVGIVLTIIAFARGHIGPGLALLLSSVVAWLVWASILAG